MVAAADTTAGARHPFTDIMLRSDFGNRVGLPRTGQRGCRTSICIPAAMVARCPCSPFADCIWCCARGKIYFLNTPRYFYLPTVCHRMLLLRRKIPSPTSSPFPVAAWLCSTILPPRSGGDHVLRAAQALPHHRWHLHNATRINGMHLGRSWHLGHRN